MKKLLTVTLCLILAISTAMMFGCEKSAFDGDYTEATATEVSAMAEQIAQAEGGEELDYSQGVKLVFDMDMSDGETTGGIEMNLKAIAVDNDLQMSGTMALVEGEESSSAEIYFAQEYIYTSATYEGQTVKIKMPMSIDDFIGNYAGSAGTDVTYSIADVMEMVEGEENVKWYVEDKEDVKKIKVEYAEEGMGELKVVLVYNAEYKLTAMSYEMNMSQTVGEETMELTLKMTVEPWSGTIELPSDLNTYIPMGA